MSRVQLTPSRAWEKRDNQAKPGLAMRVLNKLKIWQRPIPSAILALHLTFGKALLTGDIATLSDIHRLKQTAHYRWCTMNSERFREMENQSSLPDWIIDSTGFVLEIGPGMGNSIRYIMQNDVTRIVAVEPNSSFIPAIEEQVDLYALEDKYELVIDSVDNLGLLSTFDIGPETIDTILCIQVLCCLPDPEHTLQNMYKLLKPGGRFIFWEHNLSPHPKIAKQQRFWNPIWKFLIGGCNLERDSLRYIIGARPWEGLESLELDLSDQFMPRIGGILTKPLVQPQVVPSPSHMASIHVCRTCG